MLSLACRNCSSPILVADDARLVTCGVCSSRLAVRRNGAAAVTERLDEIDARTTEAVERLRILRRREGRLAALEKAWEKVRSRYGGRAPNGVWHPPTPTDNRIWKVHSLLMGGVSLLILGGVSFSIGEKNPNIHLLTLPAAVGVVAIFACIFQLCRAQERASVAQVEKYEKARTRYLRRREKLLAGRSGLDLESVGGASHFAEQSASRPLATDRSDKTAPQLISLDCQQCAAPLEVSRNDRLVTCAHCGTQLAVKCTESAAYTEKLTEVARRATRVGDKVEELHRQALLEECDRDWERERETKWKHRRPPDPISMMMAAGFGLVWAAPATLMVVAVLLDLDKSAEPLLKGAVLTMGALFALLGYGIMGSSIHHYVRGRRVAVQFAAAEQEYRRRRAALAGELTEEQAAIAAMRNLAEPNDQPPEVNPRQPASRRSRKPR